MASAPSVDRDTLSQILSFSHTLLTGTQLEEKIIKATTLSQCFFAYFAEESAGLGLPDFPVENLPSAARCHKKF